MTGRDKIQHLLITYLLDHGSIALKLPDGIDLEIGITQESKKGRVKSDNYCWVTTSREDKSVAFDSYNLDLNFNDKRIIVIDEENDRVSVNVI